MDDVLIRDGWIVDGTGKEKYKADLSVKDGMIVAIGRLKEREAHTVLDAEGLIVSPGFIDAHAHSDTSFLLDSSYASKLYQGITTELSGQCGSTPYPALPDKLSVAKDELGPDAHDWYSRSFDDFVSKFESSDFSMAINQVMMVGHGCLRAGVIGYEDRNVTSEELETMKRLLQRDLEAGAWGLSLGLEYAPGFFADSKELCELAKVVAEYDGVVTCHLRNEGLKIAEALDELINIGRSSGVRVHVSHLKIDHFKVHGSAESVWKKIEDARRAGVRITADMYPYIASSTSLSIRCPGWSLEGGGEAVARYLLSNRRCEIVEHIRTHYFNAERADTCLINSDGGLWPEIVGRTLRNIAEELLHTTDYAEAAAEILVRTKGKAGGIFFVMDEEDMMYFLSQDVAIGSDGGSVSGDAAKVNGMPHPRAFGAIADFFRIARENGLCTLEEAVRRVTSKPAQLTGLHDRGILKVGMAADITVFDPEEIGAKATYLQPIQLAAGIQHVLVNGVVALENGKQTKKRSGCFLRKNVE